MHSNAVQNNNAANTNTTAMRIIIDFLSYYDHEIEDSMKHHRNKIVTTSKIGELMGDPSMHI
jgi:hypothetical protein